MGMPMDDYTADIINVKDELAVETQSEVVLKASTEEIAPVSLDLPQIPPSIVDKVKEKATTEETNTAKGGSSLDQMQYIDINMYTPKSEGFVHNKEMFQLFKEHVLQLLGIVLLRGEDGEGEHRMKKDFLFNFLLVVHLKGRARLEDHLGGHVAMDMLA